MMYPAGNASYSDFEHTVLGHSIDSENINSLFSNSHRQPEATTSHHSSDTLSGRLDPSAPAAQIQLNSFNIQGHHISMQCPNQSSGQLNFLSSHSPLPSGPSRYPGAAAMWQAPMFAPFPTFGESHQGDDLPLPISFDHPLPGAAAMQQAPMFTPFPTFRESHQGDDLPRPISFDHPLPGAAAMRQAPMFMCLPTFNENYQGHHWPSSVPSGHVPLPILDDYNGTLLPPFIVPSQDPICLNDFALLPSTLADYQHNFPVSLLSMDGVTVLPPAAPDYI
ncbi:uncharacterized protein EDB93DRAFT_1245153 [Suillus bovinus]|uniref:uncharacterized protein n=1 Tax=Suillus bovinus TaxID=48563 RepID=UPI001B880D4C|nr:uncharacterized protein EDB93DRAFT_1245153 [Suillus bovinus]KAG2159347.1 hypothetical protein EDB93DRAFT_1245153 [Suillus bovinus]